MLLLCYVVDDLVTISTDFIRAKCSPYYMSRSVEQKDIARYSDVHKRYLTLSVDVRRVHFMYHSVLYDVL